MRASQNLHVQRVTAPFLLQARLSNIAAARVSSETPAKRRLIAATIRAAFKGDPEAGATPAGKPIRGTKTTRSGSVGAANAAAGSSAVLPAPHPQHPLGLVDNLLLSALWPEGLSKKAQELAAYMQMARPINLLPSFMLVFVGAWAGSGRSLAAFSSGSVWLTSALSGGVAVASVVVNDYFDFTSGIDGVNAPEKPLPSGVIPPDGALLFSSAIYMAVLISACFMEPPLLRSIIAFSAGATLLYTPLLKAVTGLKNAVVASIIALSPMAGALAAGSGPAGLAAVAGPCAFVFCAILYRELLMDISDVEGDRAAGVRTIPVVLGKEWGMRVAQLLFTAATALGLVIAARGSGLSWLWLHHSIQQPAVRAVASLAFLGVVQPVFRAASCIWAARFGKDVLQRAIDDTLGPIGLGMILLAVLA